MNTENWTIFGPPVFGRKCGSCTECCKIVPVEEPLNKPGGVRCVHLRHHGCGIYADRPMVCRYWNCAWLYQPEAKILRRPDLSGYAVDPMLQTIHVNGQPCEVIQVWVDKDRPDAHRAPELRAYLAEMARRHAIPAIIRWPNGEPQAGQEAMTLFAPCLSGRDEWIEIRQPMVASMKAVP